MITASFLLAALLLQEPVPEPSAAEKYLASMQATLAKAPALHLSATAAMSVSMGEEVMPMGTINFDIHFARPLNGWATMEGAILIMGMKEEISNSFLLDGEAIWVADHQQQTLIDVGSDFGEFAQGLPGLDFAAWWMGVEVGDSELELLEDAEGHPGLTGLKISGDDSESITWFDPKGIPVSGTVVPDDGAMGMPSFELSFANVEMPAKIKLEDYAVELPEDYAIVDMDEMLAPDPDDWNKNLRAVGDQAPEVSFIGMDDVESKLSAYRGKTVLLNFWFYH